MIRPGPLVDFADFHAPGRLGREVGPWYVAIGGRKSPLSVLDVGTGARVIRSYIDDFDSAPDIVNLVESPAPTRAELVGRLRTVRPDLKIIWFPSLLLRTLSAPAKWAQRGIDGRIEADRSLRRILQRALQAGRGRVGHRQGEADRRARASARRPDELSHAVRPLRILDLRDTHEIGGPGKTILETYRAIDHSRFTVHLGLFRALDERGRHPVPRGGTVDRHAGSRGAGARTVRPGDRSGASRPGSRGALRHRASARGQLRRHHATACGRSIACPS